MFAIAALFRDVQSAIARIGQPHCPAQLAMLRVQLNQATAAGRCWLGRKGAAVLAQHDSKQHKSN
jgi:hypothetical protein